MVEFYNLFSNSNVDLPTQRGVVERLHWQVPSPRGLTYAEVDASVVYTVEGLPERPRAVCRCTPAVPSSGRYTPIEGVIGHRKGGSVLVQREMESGRAPLASITPIPRGQFAPPEAWRPGGRVPAAETATGFIKKESG